MAQTYGAFFVPGGAPPTVNKPDSLGKSITDGLKDLLGGKKKKDP